MRKLCIAISVVFHPMLMPILGIFLIFQAGTHISFLPLDAKRIIFFTVFLSTAILPLSLLPLLYQFKVIKSFNMHSARERTLPVFLTGFFFFLGYSLLKKMGVPAIIGNVILFAYLAVFAAVVITYFWKISIHMIGLGGVMGAIFAVSFNYGIDLSGWLTVLLIISSITASARLYLGSHNPAQVYAGFLLGFLAVSASVFI